MKITLILLLTTAFSAFSMDVHLSLIHISRLIAISETGWTPMKKKSLPVFFGGLLMCGCQMKEVINEYKVVPLPVTMSEQQGRFYLNSDVPIVVNLSLIHI